MSDLLRLLLIVVHLTVAAIWLGSMSYSLTVVQPKVAAFLPDTEAREPFLVLLAHGNRWKVVGLVAALIATGLGVAVLSDGLVVIGYAVALLLYAEAATIFWYVSWRHWPARIFAVSEELPGFQRQLHMLATTMLALVAVAFLVALTVSVGIR
jgi:Flp pilus assembly protein TadB